MFWVQAYYTPIGSFCEHVMGRESTFGKVDFALIDRETLCSFCGRVTYYAHKKYYKLVRFLEVKSEIDLCCGAAL